MDIKQLEIFVRIVETKSFSKAADILSITQPTASGHIQSLEESLGITLLDRLGREVVPTKAGKLLYAYAGKILALRDEASQALCQFMGQMKGELTIGGSNIPGEYLLPGIIQLFHTEYPAIKVVLKIGDTSEITAGVAADECELGIVGYNSGDKKLDYRVFGEDELVVVAAPGYPMGPRAVITAKELVHIPFVMRERGSGSRMAIEKGISELGLNPTEINTTAEMGSTVAVKQAVKAGLGVTIISSLAVAEDLHNKTLEIISFKGKKLVRNFFIILRHGRTLSPIGKAFWDFLTIQHPIKGKG